MILLYIHPRNTITIVFRLTIQRHGYGKLANTLLVATSEGVVQGWDARFLLNYRKGRGIRNTGAQETLTK
jgi:hypothetical protein